MASEYLGDGLTVIDTGLQFELHCDRQNGRNWVGLEDEVLQAFFRFIERSRGVKITISRAATGEDT